MLGKEGTRVEDTDLSIYTDYLLTFMFIFQNGIPYFLAEEHLWPTGLSE